MVWNSSRIAARLCLAGPATSPLSRVLAASSALPVVLSPITLENYAGRCDYRFPAWAVEALKDAALT